MEPGRVMVSESSRGTIEQWFLSSYPLWFLLFLKLLLVNFVNSLKTILLIVLILITTSIPLYIEIIILILTSVLGMSGIGYIFGRLALIYKRITDIIAILQYALLAIISLPSSTSYISNIIPVFSTDSMLKKKSI